MKRVLLITIPFMLSCMIGIFFLGKEVIFSTIDYHIPKGYKIEVGNHINPNFIYVKLYNKDGYQVDNYDQISAKQRRTILDKGILRTCFANVYPWWACLYILFVAAFIIYFIQWCVSLDCCKPSGRYDTWMEQCNCGLCEKRCKFYNELNELDLTPAKTRFKSFWGYTN